MSTASFLGLTGSRVNNEQLSESLLGDEPKEQQEEADEENQVPFVVKVPEGARGGQVVKLQLPGASFQRIVVPPGLDSGEKFKVVLNRTLVQPSLTDDSHVVVPGGVSTGQTFPAYLPDGRSIQVQVPPGAVSGQRIPIVSQEQSSQLPAQDQPSLQTQIECLEPEQAAFLAALPEELQQEALLQLNS